MQLSTVLPEGMVFPYDFGFIPSTLGDDGDPLDILIFDGSPRCGRNDLVAMAVS
jgi:inorganic pyrophosphatase